MIFYIYSDFTIGSGVSGLTITIVRVKITNASATILARAAGTVVYNVLTSCVSVTIRAYAKELTRTSVNTRSSVSAHSLITFVNWY